VDQVLKLLVLQHFPPFWHRAIRTPASVRFRCSSRNVAGTLRSVSYSFGRQRSPKDGHDQGNSDESSTSSPPPMGLGCERAGLCAPPRRFAKRSTNTNRAGMMNMAIPVAAAMPPITVVPMI